MCGKAAFGSRRIAVWNSSIARFRLASVFVDDAKVVVRKGLFRIEADRELLFTYRHVELAQSVVNEAETAVWQGQTPDRGALRSCTHRSLWRCRPARCKSYRGEGEHIWRSRRLSANLLRAKLLRAPLLEDFARTATRQKYRAGPAAVLQWLRAGATRLGCLLGQYLGW